MNWWSWVCGWAGGFLAAVWASDHLTFLEFVGATAIVSLVLAIAETVWEERFTA